MQLTNISERKVILGHGLPLGLLMINDMVPRSPGYVSVGSRRYQDWQTLAFKATTDQTDAMIQYDTEPHVIRLVYRTTTQTLARSKEKEETKYKEFLRVTRRTTDDHGRLHRAYRSRRFTRLKTRIKIGQTCCSNRTKRGFWSTK